MTHDEVLTVIALLAVFAACGLSAVTFLKNGEDPAAVRKRQLAAAALFFAGAGANIAAGAAFGYSSGGLWFLFGCLSLQQVPGKDQIAERQAELAAAAQAELERGNAEADKLAADLNLKPMPRLHDQ